MCIEQGSAFIPFQVLVLKNGSECFLLMQGVLFSLDQRLLLGSWL